MAGLTPAAERKLADAEKYIDNPSRFASAVKGLRRLVEDGQKQLAKDPAISQLTAKDRESINISIHAIEEFIAKHS